VTNTWNPSGTALVKTDDGKREGGYVEPSELERFEQLAENLVRVPKSEVDEKRTAS
jgi:hypothetical protein